MAFKDKQWPLKCFYVLIGNAGFVLDIASKLTLLAVGNN
jgi:hypothetical protein